LDVIRGGSSCSVETARQNLQEFPVARFIAECPHDPICLGGIEVMSPWFGGA
jgi:hypothetical protein